MSDPIDGARRLLIGESARLLALIERSIRLVMVAVSRESEATGELVAHECAHPEFITKRPAWLASLLLLVMIVLALWGWDAILLQPVLQYLAAEYFGSVGGALAATTWIIPAFLILVDIILAVQIAPLMHAELHTRRSRRVWFVVAMLYLVAVPGGLVAGLHLARASARGTSGPGDIAIAFAVGGMTVLAHALLIFGGGWILRAKEYLVFLLQGRRLRKRREAAQGERVELELQVAQSVVSLQQMREQAKSSLDFAMPAPAWSAEAAAYMRKQFPAMAPDTEREPVATP